MRKKKNYFAPPFGQIKTTVPVKRVADRWEFFNGDEVPVKHGTMGELTISMNQISDPTFLQRVTKEATFMVLEEDTPLLVALSDQSQNRSRIGD
jgi:hypothetical protein